MYRENHAENLGIIPGLQDENKCTTMMPLTREPGERRKVDDMGETKKYAEAEEEMLQVHSDSREYLAQLVLSLSKEEISDLILDAGELLARQ